MLDSINTESSLRFTNIEQIFTAISDDDDSQPLNKFLKGIIWVYLYGIWEYVATESVAQINNAITASNVKCCLLKNSLLCLALNRDLEAAHNVGRDKKWIYRKKIFDIIGSEYTVVIDSSLFPTDGRNINRTQLESLQSIFSFEGTIFPESRLIGRLHELVENRRSIAHGRSIPEEVGKRYTKSDMRKVIDDVNLLSTNFLYLCEDYIQNQRWNLTIASTG